MSGTDSSGADPAAAPFDWQMPVAVRFGAGCLDEVASHLGPRPVLVLALAPARALGLQARLAGHLRDRLLAWVDVPEGLATLALARDLAAQVWPLMDANPHAVLLAIGGGSTLDIAKLLRCRPQNHRFDSLATALRGSGPWPAMQRAPLWLVPTTAGTGSEVTRWATLWDTDGGMAVKRSLDEPFGYAERAFVDPQLALSCPLAVTRDTALDALSHALEALWNRHANPVSNLLAVAAALRIKAALPACLQDPAALAPRSQLALAALEAGLAFSQTRTALAHALSYAVTLEQGLPHGQACALWLPTAWALAEGRDAGLDAWLHQVFDHAGHLAAWLQGVGAMSGPAQAGIHDAEARVSDAMGSARGRNFIAAATTAGAGTADGAMPTVAATVGADNTGPARLATGATAPAALAAINP